MLFPNHNLKAAIAEWVIRFGSGGGL